jgi:hypothetical protein
MIHFAFAIPLNENLTKLNALSDERWNIFIKTYYQFCLLVINEVFLVNNKILYFIDHRLHIMKKIHNEFTGGLDVIMTSDFYQTPLDWNSWIFKPITNTFNIITLNYWFEYV